MVFGLENEAVRKNSCDIVRSSAFVGGLDGVELGTVLSSQCLDCGGERQGNEEG